MKTINLDSRKKTLLEVIIEAGDLIASKFKPMSRVEMKEKSKHEIVTEVDVEAESIVINAIKHSFPDDAILSEEAGGEKVHDDFCWVIDPLDGTTNFFLGNPVFTTSIGLTYDGEIVLGAIYHPILRQLFSVERGQGFQVNEEKRTVSTASTISDAFIVFCHGNDDANIEVITSFFSLLKPHCKSFRQLGSASFELALVAAGKIDAFIMPGVNPWDVAAGVLMVREACGLVVDLKGEEWNFNSKDLLACNEKLLDPLLTLLGN
jgi:myo-inositol-1(or 4)-monophosphatase